MLRQQWKPDITPPNMDLVRACWSSQIQLAFCYWSTKTRLANPNVLTASPITKIKYNANGNDWDRFTASVSDPNLTCVLIGDRLVLEF